MPTLNDKDKLNINFIANEITKNHPKTAAVLSKILERNDNNKKKSEDINVAELIPEIRTLSEKIFEKTKINDDIMELFPDALIAAEIIVGTITCPNDLMTTNLLYKFPDTFPMPDSIKLEITNIIECHIDKYYNLKEKLPKMLTEAIFTKGAYAEAFIPEASLDDMVNATADFLSKTGLESVRDRLDKAIENGSLGYLGNVEYQVGNESKDGLKDITIGNESFSIANFTSNSKNITDLTLGVGKETFSIKLPNITDDFTVVKNVAKELGIVKNTTFDNIRKSRLSKVGVEDFDLRDVKAPEEDDTYASKQRVEDYLSMFMKRAKKASVIKDDVEFINNKTDASRQSIGRPLVLNLPVESIIPVHSPLNIEDHLGYFVLLDDEGKILDLVNDGNKINNQLGMNNVIVPNREPNEMINKGMRQMYSITQDPDSLTQNEEIYTRIVYKMIDAKLKSGAFGSLAEMNFRNDNMIYKLMFRRALQNKGTQLVFLPAELVSYYAFDYRDNGTGKSLFERTALLYSIRATLLMSTIFAHLRNSINTTNVDITLDENINNPDAVLEQIASRLIKNRERSIPFGLVRPEDVYNHLAGLGYKFNVNSPNMPELKIEATQTNASVVVPDQQVDDKLMEMQTLTYGITPEMIRGGFDPDFATSVVGRQSLMNKRTRNKIAHTNKLNSTHVRKILKVDEELRTDIMKFIAGNFGVLSQFLADTINNEQGGTKNHMVISQDAFRMYMEKCLIALEEDLRVEIPEPQVNSSSAMVENANAAFSNIDTFVDAVFNSDVINEEMFGETIGNKQNSITGMLKAALKIKWITDNDALPGLNELLTEKSLSNDVGGNDLNDFVQTVRVLLGKFTEAFKAREDLKDVSEEIKNIQDTDNGESFGSGDGGFGGSSFGGDSGDSFGGDNNDGSFEDEYGSGNDGDNGDGGDTGGDEGGENIDDLMSGF